MSSKTSTPKHALVLSGGGSGGAVQIGALERLSEEMNIDEEFDLIVGTSVGALNACALAYGSFSALKYIWRSIEGRSDVLSYAFWKTKGLFSTTPLRGILKEVTSGVKAHREAASCTVNIDTGEILYASNRKLIKKEYLEYTECSTLIPFFMEPVKGYWFDGGIRENTPLSYAIERGARRVTVLAASPLNSDQILTRYHPFFPHALSHAYRTVDSAMQHEILKNDISRCHRYNEDGTHERIKLTLISPDRDRGVGTLDFDPIKIKKMMALGYESAVKNRVEI